MAGVGLTVGAMAKTQKIPSACFREVEVERLILREPGSGRVRAVLETVPAEDEDAPPFRVVRLTLRAPDGKPGLVAEIGADGAPRLSVGHPDHGVTATISDRALDFWRGGNIVATVRSTEDGGKVELTDGQGTRVVELPDAG